MTKKKLKLKKSIINNIVIIVLLVVMLIHFSFAVYIYNINYEVDYYKAGSKEYSYITINRVSDTFAKINTKELHLAEDKNNIYIIAIDSSDKKWKNIIYKDNTKSLKVYVMPIKSSKKIKLLAEKNITKFISYDKKVDDYDNILTNYYLDTTVKKYHKFNYVVSILFLLSLVIIGTVLELEIKNKKSK